MKKIIKLRKYHAPVWNEPIIMEMSHEGERGILIPESEKEIKEKIGNANSYVPVKIRRKELPNLPELSQAQILRHYEHLAQQTLGMEGAIDISEGTCTMKYSPKINEMLVRTPQVTEIHPLQDEETIQGILEIVYKFARFLEDISGMDEFVFQAGGGADAVYTNACMVRKYWELKGELDKRNEIITTAFSHPCDSAATTTAGFKIITLYPDEETGVPSVEALKSAVSEHTAALFITNPEDTGIYNSKIDEFTKIVHEVGGLCQYDQANANVLLGIARAKEANFDICFFNVHKTFSSPHGCMGPACGAVGVKKELAKFLPVPVVTYDGEKYHLDYNRENSIGKIREFFGNVPVVLRAYSWIMSMGSQGLKKVAETSALNNSYLVNKLLAIPGITMKYSKENPRRLDQVRWSLGKLKKDTGITKEDINRRLVDYGIPSFWYAHPPELVPEPFTVEPCETYSKEDCDYWAAALEQVCKEAYENPEIVKSAPHNVAIHKIKDEVLDNPKKWAMTWRAYLKKKGKSK